MSERMLAQTARRRCAPAAAVTAGAPHVGRGGGRDRGQGERLRFDALVLGCHGDEALGLIEHPTALERELLGCLPLPAQPRLSASGPGPDAAAPARLVLLELSARPGRGPDRSGDRHLLDEQPAGSAQGAGHLRQPQSGEPAAAPTVIAQMDYDHPVFDAPRHRRAGPDAARSRAATGSGSAGPGWAMAFTRTGCVRRWMWPAVLGYRSPGRRVPGGHAPAPARLPRHRRCTGGRCAHEHRPRPTPVRPGHAPALFSGAVPLRLPGVQHPAGPGSDRRGRPGAAAGSPTMASICSPFTTGTTGPGMGRPLRDWLLGNIDRLGLDLPIGRIEIQCYPARPGLWLQSVEHLVLLSAPTMSLAGGAVRGPQHLRRASQLSAAPRRGADGSGRCATRTPRASMSRPSSGCRPTTASASPGRATSPAS